MVSAETDISILSFDSYNKNDDRKSPPLRDGGMVVSDLEAGVVVTPFVHAGRSCDCTSGEQEWRCFDCLGERTGRRGSLPDAASESTATRCTSNTREDCRQVAYRDAGTC